MSVATLASPGPDDQRFPRVLDQIINGNTYFAKATFYTVRDWIRRTVAATEAILDKRKLAIDKAAEAAALGIKEDPNGHKRLPFAVAVSFAFVLTLLDGIPGNWAAQALNVGSNTITLAVTGLFVVCLGSLMFAAHGARSGRQRQVVWLAILAILAFMAYLRWAFVSVMTNDLTSALMEAAGLSLVTLAILFAGMYILGLAKSQRLSQLEAEAADARRIADDQQREANELAERAKAEEAQFMSIVIADSMTVFSDEGMRDAFIEWVRRELHR